MGTSYRMMSHKSPFKLNIDLVQLLIVHNFSLGTLHLDIALHITVDIIAFFSHQISIDQLDCYLFPSTH